MTSRAPNANPNAKTGAQTGADTGAHISGSSPGWQRLTGLAVLVIAAHALVLRASPAHLGRSTDAGNQTFTTRAIRATGATPTPAAPAEVAPAPAQQALPTAATAAAAAKKSKAAKPISNQPLAQQIHGQLATEIIAVAEPPSALPIAAEAPVESAAANPSTQPIAAPATDLDLNLNPNPTPNSNAKTKANTLPITAISLPGSARLLYKVTGQSKNLNYQATAELNWATDGNSYDAMMKVSAFLVGSRSMTSVGKITGGGLAPTRFADKFKSELAAHFEPEKGKITFSANTPDAPWTDGVQDRVSVFLQLAGMLAANPAGYPPGSDVSFLTVGPRDSDTWTFVMEAEENLNLMNAPMRALKLTRKPRKEFDQKVEIWFAPSVGYLPVRSRITQQSGDFVDQQLTEIIKNP